MSKIEGLTRLRAVFQKLCPTGADSEAVNAPKLVEILGLQPHEKQTLRRRINDMLLRGELRRTEVGWYVYVAEKEPCRFGGSYERIWRAVHVQNTSFTVRRIMQISRFGNITINRYLNFLEKEGFIELIGRDGRSQLYRLTVQGQNFQEVPYPLTSLNDDPNRAERMACAILHRLLLEDTDSPHVRRRICQQLAVLNATFNQHENGGNTDV